MMLGTKTEYISSGSPSTCSCMFTNHCFRESSSVFFFHFNLHQYNIPLFQKLSSNYGAMLVLSPFLLLVISSTVSALSIDRLHVRSLAPSFTSRTAKRNDTSCEYGPSSRGCWGSGFDINTDTATSWPNTGRVVPVSNSVLMWQEVLINLTPPSILSL